MQQAIVKGAESSIYGPIKFEINTYKKGIVICMKVDTNSILARYGAHKDSDGPFSNIHYKTNSTLPAIEKALDPDPAAARLKLYVAELNRCYASFKMALQQSPQISSNFNVEKLTEDSINMEAKTRVASNQMILAPNQLVLGIEQLKSLAESYGLVRNWDPKLASRNYRIGIIPINDMDPNHMGEMLINFLRSNNIITDPKSLQQIKNLMVPHSSSPQILFSPISDDPKKPLLAVSRVSEEEQSDSCCSCTLV